VAALVPVLKARGTPGRGVEQRDRKFADSPLEEAVTSELVSEAQIPC
jgi:hypothetical protein